MTSNTERFPSDINLTLEDFTNSKWEEAFQGDDANILEKASDALAKMGQKATEEEKISPGKALWILADGCSMTLHLFCVNEPFKPYYKN